MNATTSPHPTEATPVEAEPAEPTFDALPLTAEVRQAIDEMGYVNPTPVQVATYAPTVDGKDLIVQARTGTGKTAAFGIPMADRLLKEDGGVQALVLAPTRELALQSSRELGQLGKHKGIRTAAVYGGAAMGPQVRELEDGAQIVSGTPGRVLDHLRRGTLKAAGLHILVLDEADEMLSMGFAKELNSILEMLPDKRQTLLFSATVDHAVQRMAERYMKSPEFVGLSSDQVGATTVSHFVYMVSGKGRANDLIQVLEIEDPESAVIFCNTKAETESVAHALQQAGFNADWLNGDLPQSEREKVMDRTRKGTLRYMVATDVAARGIDISHLTHVINYSFPVAVQQYIHRTGRTGRAGRTGTAISVVSPQELGSLYYLRLQFKIFPVERSLPTLRETETRREVDQIAILEETFGAAGDELDRAVARRLLTHPEAERLVAGLLHSILGPKETLDERGQKARKERRPAPQEVNEAPDTEPRRRRRAPRGEEAPREVRQDRAEAPRGRPRPVREARPDREEAPRVRTRPQTNDAPQTHDAPQAAASDAESDAHREEHTGEGEPSQEDMTRLYVNVGRRDGMRAGDLARILREQGELKRADIGRIRVRDKHSFVEVLTERVEELVTTLKGQTVKDRELVVEPARAGS